MPVSLVYSNLPPQIKETYIQLRGLAWQNKYIETPAMTFKDLAEEFGKSLTIVYEHVRCLRVHSWLQFRDAGGAAYIFSFPNPIDLSEDQETGINSLSLDISILDLNIKEREQREQNNIGIPENRKPAKKVAKTASPGHSSQLTHPAVVLYRNLMHKVPNSAQCSSIATSINELALWQTTLEHWLMHGWKPTNVGGMINSYQQGGRDACTTCNRKGIEALSPRGKANASDIDEIFGRLSNGELR